MFESKEKEKGRERERGRKRDQPRFTPMCVRGHVRARAAPARLHHGRGRIEWCVRIRTGGTREWNKREKMPEERLITGWEIAF